MSGENFLTLVNKMPIDNLCDVCGCAINGLIIALIDDDVKWCVNEIISIFA
jgi:hypothetical protein